jgi:hypothetical protein
MFKIIFTFLIIVISIFLFENTQGEFIAFGEINSENETIYLIEKNLIKNESFNNTSFNIELSDLFYTNSDTINLNNNSYLNSQPIVIINTSTFNCSLEKINSESICLSLSDCDGEEHCAKFEEISNLIIIGKKPIYSFVASENGIHSKLVKLQPGEYEIVPNNNDVVSSNYCNEIELDGVGFQEFTMGTSISQDNTSVLCINIGDGCYGMIKNGETKVCDTNKVFIKNLM